MKKLIIIFLLISSNLQANTIKNNTRYDVDELAQSALKCMQVKDIVLNIKYINKNDFKRHIFKGITYEQADNFVYVIYLDDNLTEYELKSVLMHEIIHVHQYFTDKLIKINDNLLVFNDEQINLKKTIYATRAFEREANILIVPLMNFIKNK